MLWVVWVLSARMRLLLMALCAWWLRPGVQAARPACGRARDCVAGHHLNDEFFFTVHGQNLVINFSEAQYVELECPEGVALGGAGMPSFDGGARVLNVTLRRCSIGADSLADALGALNISVLERLSLKDTPPGSLSALHLRGLEHLLRLDLEGTRGMPLRVEAGALLPLVNLRMLQLNRVQMASLQFPPTLHSLQLWFVGETRLDLSGLDQLRALVVHEKESVTVSALTAGSLESVVLDARRVSFPAASRPRSIRRLVLVNWNETDLSARCDDVELLQLRGWVGEEPAPPRRWLSHCKKLREFRMSFARQKSVTPGLLDGAENLEDLGLTSCQIDTLPVDLFKENRNLRIIDLSHNKLQTLPSGLFSNLRNLKELNLSNNKLQAAAVGSLGSLVSLQDLNLSHNPPLLDLCSGGSDAFIVSGTSPLKALTELEELRLGHTGVSHVCSDWRTSMKQLRLLDLSYTNITSLSYLDFHYEHSGSKELTVNFNGTPVTELTVDAGNYKSVIADLASASVKIILRATLPCDCSDYWTALAFGDLSTQAQDSVELLCREEERGSLADALERESLECAESSLCEDQEGCTCSVRLDLSLGVVATASCEGAGLDEMPSRLKFKEAPVWRLMLAHNHIQTVRLQDLPDTILELDLRNNSLHRLDGPTASKLSTVPLWIANNSLDCTCYGYDLVTKLGPHVRDMEQATCDDGTSLKEAQNGDPSECSSALVVATSLISALALLAVMVAVTAGCVMRPEMRLRIKVLLLRLGWLPRRPEPDDGRRFDAFVSYAHEDEAVVEELVKRLEVGHGYRLCLHYRDWAPGEWIHVQIAASVQASRRTLIVVSRHFLRSKWARQEFRQAHAAALRDVTPRLVLLFLEPPHRLPLDAELRSYIRINTYVLWTDPWFWHKLKLALPPPRLLPTPLEDVSVNKAESSPLHGGQDTKPCSPEAETDT